MTQQRGKDGIFRPIAVSEAMKHMVSLTQPWQTADGRWLLPHTNLPHLEKEFSIFYNAVVHRNQLVKVSVAGSLTGLNRRLPMPWLAVAKSVARKNG